MVCNKLFDLPDSWDNTEKLSFLQRRVIIYSIQYYMFDSPVVSDLQFDACARQLENLMKDSTKEECERSKYWYCMNNFTSATGFDLYSRLNDKDRKYLTHLADIIIDDYRKVYMAVPFGFSRDQQGI